jgi:hypothetical protein
MPADFECSECDLHFSVGWFHYHSFESGYGSKTLLVCRRCGTRHAIEHALSDRGPQFYELHDVLVTAADPRFAVAAMQLLRKHLSLGIHEAKNKLRMVPFVLAKDVPTSDISTWRQNLSRVGLSAEYPVSERIANEAYGPLQKDRLLYDRGSGASMELHPVPVSGEASGAQNELVLSEQVCANCSDAGALVSGWAEENHVCPRCQLPSLAATGFWIT